MRFLGYFFAVLLALVLLREVPVIGAIFRIPVLGFFAAAAVVSAIVARVGTGLTARRGLSRQVRELGQVETPAMRGKLGRLLLQSGKPREAVEPLEEAVEGDPESPEWRYRLGQARLESGDLEGGLASLEEALQLDERHAYGEVLLRAAEARAAAGDGEGGLSAVERFEVLQGPSPRSAFRRGEALRALGRGDEARDAFQEVGALAREVPGYQRREATGWALRAWWARLLG